MKSVCFFVFFLLVWKAETSLLAPWTAPCFNDPFDYVGHTIKNNNNNNNSSKNSKQGQ